jgi:hypothetical protein
MKRFTIRYTWVSRFGNGNRETGSMDVLADNYDVAISYVKSVVGSTFQLPYDITNRLATW